MNQRAKDAKELLTDIGLFGVPVNPVAVCRKLGIFYQEAPYENFEGLLIVAGDKTLIGVNSKVIEPGRKAFTCAHELGHVFYDIYDKKEFGCNRNDIGFGKGKLNPIEVRANEFASELLLPTEFFAAEIHNKEPSWALIKQLSEKFDCSLQAAASKFVKTTHQVCWLVIVRDGLILRSVKADYNTVLPEVKKSFKPPQKDPGRFQEVAADFWMYESRKAKNKKVAYWPLPENQYKESYVLLWNKGGTLLNDEYQNDEFDEENQRVDDDIYRRGRW